jgi:hypothetical protein
VDGCFYISYIITLLNGFLANHLTASLLYLADLHKYKRMEDVSEIIGPVEEKPKERFT